MPIRWKGASGASVKTVHYKRSAESTLEIVKAAVRTAAGTLRVLYLLAFQPQVALALPTTGNFPLLGITPNYLVYYNGWGGQSNPALLCYDRNWLSVGSLTLNVTSSPSSAMAASIGNYALFTGGYNASGTPVATTYAVSNALVRSNPTVLSKARGLAGAGNCGSAQAVIGGGDTSTGATMVPSAVVNAYSPTLALSTPTALSVARVAPAGLSGDTYAMFAGGTDASVVQKMTVEAYGTTLARTICASLSANAFSNIMYGYVGFSDYFVISSGSGIYQVYNKSLVMTTVISSPIPGQSQSACATADRKRALFMGFTSGKVPVVVSMESTLTIRAERATSPVVQNATGIGFQNWVAFAKGTYYNEAGSGVYNHAFTRYRYIA